MPQILPERDYLTQTTWQAWEVPPLQDAYTFVLLITFRDGLQEVHVCQANRYHESVKSVAQYLSKSIVRLNPDVSRIECQVAYRGHENLYKYDWIQGIWFEDQHGDVIEVDGLRYRLERLS